MRLIGLLGVAGLLRLLRVGGWCLGCFGCLSSGSSWPRRSWASLQALISSGAGGGTTTPRPAICAGGAAFGV
eukprot:14065802-Alexandrium_andersonii.AAC.1